MKKNYPYEYHIIDILIEEKGINQGNVDAILWIIV